jgi:hypothetical protein
MEVNALVPNVSALAKTEVPIARNGLDVTTNYMITKLICQNKIFALFV